MGWGGWSLRSDCVGRFAPIALPRIHLPGFAVRASVLDLPHPYRMGRLVASLRPKFSLPRHLRARSSFLEGSTSLFPKEVGRSLYLRCASLRPYLPPSPPSEARPPQGGVSPGSTYGVGLRNPPLALWARPPLLGGGRSSNSLPSPSLASKQARPPSREVCFAGLGFRVYLLRRRNRGTD